MNQAIRQRIDTFVQRQLSHPRKTEQESALQHERRLAHEHVLSEIPLARDRLSSAVGELNDSISDARIHLKLADDSSEYFALEDSFRVLMWPDGEESRALHFHILHDGEVVVLMSFGERRIRLMSVEVWAADRNFFLEALISFLEAAVA